MPAFLTRPQGGVLSAATFGARGDGVTNSSPGLQAAVDAAQTDITSIRKVVIPAGTYVLNTSVAKAGSVHIEGEGQEQTVIQPPTGAPAFTLGSMTQSQPHGMRLADMTFRINGAIASGYPVIDVQQYGRKWSMERLNFDLGFSNRPALRLWTSWTGSVRDCNFWKIGGEGLAGQRAAVIVRPQTIAATALGPINNLLFDGCVWERVQLGIDLHDGSDLTGTSTIYSVEIRNPRFKNSSTTGPTPNSIGIRSNSNSTFGVVVTSAFFEDFDIGAVVSSRQRRASTWRPAAPTSSTGWFCRGRPTTPSAQAFSGRPG
jgi:hypothetical protein